MTKQRQAPEGIVQDAPDKNWVDRYAPAAARPYLRLSRADLPIGTWLLWIPGFWAITLGAATRPGGFEATDLWLLISSAVGACVMRGAGCTWNDIADREIDAKVTRTRSRPLPSGQVSPRGALIWMVMQCIIGAVILLSYPPLAIALGVGSLGLVALYPFAKRFTWWPQAFLGLTFNWGALLLWAAQNGDIALPAVALYLAGIFWTLFYDTIYAHQDKEDDALIGVKSTARLFGDATKPWLWGFLIATALCQSVAILSFGTAQILGLLGVAAMAGHLAWQIGQLDITDPSRCLMLFRSNRDAGLIFGLFLATVL